jgi:hypothetical protein
LVELGTSSGICVASLLRQWFRELPDALLPPLIFDQAYRALRTLSHSFPPHRYLLFQIDSNGKNECLVVSDVAIRRATVKYVLFTVPPTNRLILESTIKYFKQAHTDLSVSLHCLFDIVCVCVCVCVVELQVIRRRMRVGTSQRQFRAETIGCIS